MSQLAHNMDLEMGTGEARLLRIRFHRGSSVKVTTSAQPEHKGVSYELWAGRR